MNWKTRGKYIVSFTVNLVIVLFIGFYGVGWFWRGFLSDVFIVVLLFFIFKNADACINFESLTLCACF